MRFSSFLKVAESTIWDYLVTHRFEEDREGKVVLSCLCGRSGVQSERREQ